MASHDWLYGTERVFQTIQCAEEEKVMFIAHMVKGLDGRWWDTISTYFTSQIIPKDWQHFKIFLS